MTTAHERKKQPERVRRTLLDCAARLAVEHGLAAVTVQAVAEAAGVTKGGLFHHFPSKQALIDAVFSDLLQSMDEQIDRLIAKDSDPHGCFTRAYVEAIFADRHRETQSLWAALSISMMTEPSLRAIWSRWLDGRLTRHRATDHGLRLDMVRLAADGIWLADLLSEHGTFEDRTALHALLIEETRGKTQS